MNDEIEKSEMLDPVRVYSNPSIPELAARHNLPADTRFEGEVGTGYVDYWLPGSHANEPSGQIFDERYYVDPAKRTGTHVIDIHEWNEEEKKKKRKNVKLKFRKTSGDAKTPANAAARVATGRVSDAARYMFEQNNAHLAKLRALNKKYSKSWNPYQWLRNDLRRETIKVLESQNMDLESGNARSIINQLNDAGTAFVDALFEGSEELTSLISDMIIEDIDAVKTLDYKVVLDLAFKRAKAVGSVVVDGYDAVVNKPWFPETRAKWDAGLYGDAIGGIGLDFAGIAGLAKTAGKKLAAAVSRGAISGADKAAIEAGHLTDELATKARKAGVTDEEINATKKVAEDTEHSKASGETVTAGDPVSVTSGEYVETWTDYSIEATIPLIGERYYGNQFGIEYGPLGRNRISPFDVHIIVKEKKILEFVSHDGKRIQFERPCGNRSVRNIAYPRLKMSSPKFRYLEIRNGFETWLFLQNKDLVYRLIKIEDTNKNFIKFVRDSEGTLLEAIHSDGFSLKFANDNLGRRISISWVVENNFKPLVDYHYDKFGNLIAANCSTAFSIHYTYDEKNRLTSWQDETGRSGSRFFYDAQDRVIKTETTGPWNNDVFEYDRENRLTTYRPGGKDAAERFWYDEDENVIKQENALGHITQYSYNEAGFKTSQIDQCGHQKIWDYDIYGNVKSFTDAEGRWTHTAWSDFNVPIVEIDGEGYKRRYDYDLKGNVTTIIDPDNSEIHLEWTENGRLSQILYPNGASEKRFYNTSQQLIAVTHTNGCQTHFKRDVFGRVVAMIDPNHHVTRFAYADIKAKDFYEPTTIERPDGVVIERSFDSEGIISKVKDGEGRQWEYINGAFDLLIGLKEPGGGELSFEYDVLKRLVKVTDALKNDWIFERDKAGNVIKETDFSGLIYHYDYDATGQLSKIYQPDGTRIEYLYDKSGLLIEECSYDSSAQLEDKTTFHYDLRRFLIRAENKTATITFKRDALGRVIGETCNGRKITNRYDGVGNRTSRRIGGALVTAQYDPLGLIKQLIIGKHAPLSFERDNLGREKLRRSASGFRLEQSYDALGQLTRQKAGLSFDALGKGLEGLRRAQQAKIDPQAATAQVDRYYQWNKSFEPIIIGDQRWGMTAYQYDNNGQIDKASFADASRECFSYDLAKNITGFGEAVSVNQRWKLAQAGRVDEARGPNGERVYLKYDSRNRVVVRRVQRNGFRFKIWRYQWDAKDRLIATITPEGERWTYGYDPFGRRVHKINSNAAKAAMKAQGNELSTEEQNRGAYYEDLKSNYAKKNGKIIVGTAYLWDGEVIAEEADMLGDGSADWDNATSWHYHPETFVPIAKETASGELFYIVTDHLGTPREMFSEDGHLVWAALYRTWGGVKHIWKPDNDNNKQQITFPPGGGSNLAVRFDRVEERDAQDCPLRFQGQWHDAETDLYYNRFRYYDPLIGQYLSPDPLGLEGGTRPNAYVQNPNSEIDPWGLVALDEPGYTLYHIINKSTGKVTYVGITKNFDLRLTQHRALGRLGNGYTMGAVEKNLIFAQARGFEQADIKYYNALRLNERGLPIEPGSGNRAHSYAPDRVDERALDFKKYEAQRTAYHKAKIKANKG